MQYFSKLLDLLKLEREEDRLSYKTLTESSSTQERRSNGLCWYPIAIRGSEMSRGDYLTVEVERTTHQDIPHQLRFGMPAAMFSNHNSGTDRIDGIIAHQSGNMLRITLKTDELPDWARDGKLGIDRLFDDNSYDEMTAALRLASSLADKEPAGKLIKILIGEKAPGFRSAEKPLKFPNLNPSQEKAVNTILNANELAIVHGPPGTGKTTTLVQAIKALIEQDHKQILVVAPSNTAVDLLTEKLSERGLNVLRVGNPARVSERLMSLTLDSKVAAHPRMKEIKTLKKQANEYKNMGHKYKRNFGRAEREQRKALFDEAHRIMKEVSNTEQYITDDVLSKAQVITATLVGANHYTVKKRTYHTVVMDEAGQALEPAAWIAILKAEKVIMAGDHFQLSPTIKSQEAGRLGLSKTLLEKNALYHPEAVILLEEQYRMHEQIMGYSSDVFYNNRLQAHPSVAQHLLFEGDRALEYVDTAGCGFEEKADGTSTVNPEEAAFLFKHFSQLAKEIGKYWGESDFPSVAIISPYKSQINVLTEQLEQSPLKIYGNKISVNTIDSFQGQERDIVYISMTRSNNDGEIGFLSDIRRMNVAMTRARKKLVIIGDSATLSQDKFYHNFITYAESINAYKSAWEYLVD